MKQYILKDALFVASVVLGVVTNLKSTLLLIIFTAILIAYIALRYFDNTIIIKK